MALSPTFDGTADLIRVGGRLRFADLPEETSIRLLFQPSILWLISLSPTLMKKTLVMAAQKLLLRYSDNDSGFYMDVVLSKELFINV